MTHLKEVIIIKIKAKILVILNLLILILTSMCACSAKTTNNNSLEIDPTDLAKYIKENIVFKDDLQIIDDQNLLKKLYSQIDFSYISDFCVYTSASGATAEEIAIFKITDEMYNDDIKQAIKTRMDNQIKNFENYIPEEVYKINNSVIDKTQNIVMYISCDTPDDIENVLKKFYNNK